MYRSILLAAIALAVSLTVGCAWVSRRLSPSPGTGPVGATLTIDANGSIAPKTITIRPGQVVTFTNNDSKPHSMFSDPHPVHTDCREINAVGKLQPGESRNTATFEQVETCGFHDHDDADNKALRGSIAVAN